VKYVPLQPVDDYFRGGAFATRSKSNAKRVVKRKSTKGDVFGAGKAQKTIKVRGDTTVGMAVFETLHIQQEFWTTSSDDNFRQATRGISSRTDLAATGPSRSKPRATAGSSGAAVAARPTGSRPRAAAVASGASGSRPASVTDDEDSDDDYEPPSARSAASAGPKAPGSSSGTRRASQFKVCFVKDHSLHRSSDM